MESIDLFLYSTTQSFLLESCIEVEFIDIEPSVEIDGLTISLPAPEETTQDESNSCAKTLHLFDHDGVEIVDFQYSLDTLIVPE